MLEVDHDNVLNDPCIGPQTGGGAYETGAAEVRRGPPGAVFLEKSIFLPVFGLRSGPDGSGQAVGFIWPLFRAKPSILDPFRTKFDVLGTDRNLGQPGFGLGLALGKSQ